MIPTTRIDFKPGEEYDWTSSSNQLRITGVELFDPNNLIIVPVGETKEEFFIRVFNGKPETWEWSVQANEPGPRQHTSILFHCEGHINNWNFTKFKLFIKEYSNTSSCYIHVRGGGAIDSINQMKDINGVNTNVLINYEMIPESFIVLTISVDGDDVHDGKVVFSKEANNKDTWPELGISYLAVAKETPPSPMYISLGGPVMNSRLCFTDR